MARIVLTTFGSLGDLHPYLALGIELRRRGHETLIATHADYRERAHAEGLEFAPIRPERAAPRALLPGARGAAAGLARAYGAAGLPDPGPRPRGGIECR